METPAQMSPRMLRGDMWKDAIAGEGSYFYHVIELILLFYMRFPPLLRVTFCTEEKINLCVCTDCFYSCKIYRPIHESA